MAGLNDPETIVKQALLLPTDQRDEFVRRSCMDSAELREQVLRQLKAPDSSQDSLVTVDQPAAHHHIEQPDVGQESPGDVIGQYKLLQRIGEGGFGVVYMAQQNEPVRRKVALKIIKLGMDTAQVIARFEAERQALALMDHPNIARVLDAGATDRGRPFFVMELVRGMPITDYCDQNKLSTHERLKLFVSVCRAVQHAHQKGLIHRDLKPSNIMVTLHDGVPVPKVIDFGIAKAVDRDLTERTVFTEYRHFIGTPAYMSPEQAEMSGLDIDTRSDIYSLGVVLYELVTGVTPIDDKDLTKLPLPELQRVIHEVEPPRPSTRLSTLGEQQSGIASRRRTDLSALRKALRGDLDWIIMKALEKDRTRRYDTADRFAEDIERYLVDEPVLARPPSTRYKLSKFARRNRTALTTISAIAAAMLVTIAALVYSLFEVSAERDRTALNQTISKAEILLSTMNAVRHYTTNHVRPHLTEDLYADVPFPREAVPGFSAREVFEQFRKSEGNEVFFYKEAAINPTNPRDLADEFEAGLVHRFRQQEDREDLTGYRSTERGEQFYIARAIRVTDESCLDCHSTREKAPPRMHDAYPDGGGFGWNLGDIVAAQIVYVPSSETRADISREDLIVGAALVVGFFMIVLFTYVFVSRL